jgi:hypothetical protein
MRSIIRHFGKWSISVGVTRSFLFYLKRPAMLPHANAYVHFNIAWGFLCFYGGIVRYKKRGCCGR